METMMKIQQQLDHTLKYLNPLLPLANCHMVEFFTNNHWDRFVPKSISKLIGGQEEEEVLETFWRSIKDNNDSSECPVAEFVTSARSNVIKVDEETCLSINQFESKIRDLGSELKPEIHVKEFMNPKKSYEVRAMSRLVASLHSCMQCTHCVDVGGGRGQLPAALALAYALPGLTVDCNAAALANGIKRERLMQKQWKAIAKKSNSSTSEGTNDCNTLHKYVNMFVTTSTDLCSVVGDLFATDANNLKLLLTGLHTCGNLGPDSLRLFKEQESIKALFNVPCCYHLLTEATDNESLWNAFEGNTANCNPSVGFPMSSYLKDQQLGRNARMLASQSIDRVAGLKQLPPRSLFYRAILQVIVKEHLHLSNLAEGKLKRISSKCQSLKEYVLEAGVILNLGLEELPDSFLDDISEKYASQWKNLVVFYLLRLCLAQVVESVILLDRLLYLKESGFENVYLVRVFDPVLSPRCHSIVAMR